MNGWDRTIEIMWIDDELWCATYTPVLSEDQRHRFNRKDRMPLDETNSRSLWKHMNMCKNKYQTHQFEGLITSYLV